MADPTIESHNEGQTQEKSAGEGLRVWVWFQLGAC